MDGKASLLHGKGKFDSNRYSGKFDSNRYSGKFNSNIYSGKFNSNRHSGKYSGKFNSNRYSGRYDSNEDSPRTDDRASVHKKYSNKYFSPKTTNRSTRHFFHRKRSELWKVNQRGDIDHYNPTSREWENIFPSGFNWLVGGRTTQLTAQAISTLKSGSGAGKVVVSFKSTHRKFPHSLFYEIVINRGEGRPFILIPWTTYQSEGFNGQIFCPISETNYSEDNSWLNSSPKSLGLEWAPVVCSKIELQENGDLWIEGHMVGSNRPQLFVPSSMDSSKEYLARDGKLN